MYQNKFLTYELAELYKNQEKNYKRINFDKATVGVLEYTDTSLVRKLMARLWPYPKLRLHASASSTFKSRLKDCESTS